MSAGVAEPTTTLLSVFSVHVICCPEPNNGLFIRC